MFTYQIAPGTTDVSVTLRVIDSADGTPEAGVDHATSGIDLKYRRSGSATVDITEASLAALTTAHTDGGVEQIGAGYIRVDLPDAACASGAAECLVFGTITGMVVIGCVIQLDSALNAVKVDTTAILVDTGTTLDARIPAALVSGRMDASVGAMAANVLTATAINADAITNAKIADNAIAAENIAADAITAAKIANAAIDAATFAADVDAEILSYLVDDATRIDASALNTASVTSIPAILVDTGTTLDGKIDAIDTVVDSILVDTAEIGAAGAGLTEAGGTGDQLTALATAAALATVDSEIGVIDGIVDAILVDTAEIGAAGAGLTALATQASVNTIDGIVDSILVDTAEIGAAGAGLTALGDARLANLDDAVSDAVAAPAAALVAIHLDHLLAADYDPASKPGTATALLNELVESDSGVSRFTANALEQAPTGGTAPTAGEIADAVWDEAQADHVGAGTFGIVASEIADILVDTSTTLQAEVDGIQADTEDIQSRLPAALVSGRIAADAIAISGSTAAADAVEANIANLDDAVSDAVAAAAAALTAYDPPTRTEATADKNEILTRLRGVIMHAGVIGSTGNSTTALHLTGLTYGNDEINDVLLVILDVSASEYHTRWIDDWADAGDLATVATLPFTPENAVDQYWLTSVRRDSGLTAAQVNAEVDTALADYAGATQASVDIIDGIVDSILVDTAEIGVAGAGLTAINLPNQTMDIVGNITGNLSGSVGSVTGAVGSVTGDVGGVATGGIDAASFAAGAIDAAAIANAAIDAATFAADVDAEILSYLVDDATRIDASALNTASVTTIPAILVDTGTTLDGKIDAIDTIVDAILVDTAEIGAAGAGLTAINLPNQTMDIVGNITGNLSGSVGSVTGSVGSVTGSVGSVTGAVGSVTGNVGGNVTGSVGSVTGLTASDVGVIKGVTDKLDGMTELGDGSPTYYRWEATALEEAPTGGSAPTAATIADAVWDEARADHVAGGSFGEGVASVTGSVASVATGGITAASFAANAINAAKLDPDVTTELQSGLATAAALATVDGIVDDILLDTAEIGAAGAGLTNINLPNQTMDIVGNITGNLSGSVGSVTGSVGSVTGLTAADVGVIKAVTDKLDGMTELGDGSPTYYRWEATSLEEAPTGGSAPTAATIADAVWDELLSGHAISGSTGEALSAAGTAGDPWLTALPGAYGSGTAGKIVGDNINATVSSRSTQTSVDDLPTNAELATALGTADDAILAILGAPAGASLAADIAAIEAQTDDIGVAGAGLTAIPTVAAIGAGGITAASFAADAITAAKVAADVTTEIQSGLATAAALATVDTVADSILALLDDARGEPGQGAPPVNPDMATKVDYLYKLMRNKITQTSTTLSVFADDAATVDHKATVSDDSVTYTRGELAAGP